MLTGGGAQNASSKGGFGHLKAASANVLRAVLHGVLPIQHPGLRRCVGPNVCSRLAADPRSCSAASPRRPHCDIRWARVLTPNQIVDWKNQLRERAASVFGAESTAVPTVDLKELHAEIGQLALANDFFSGAFDALFRAAPNRFKGRRPEPHPLPTAHSHLDQPTTVADRQPEITTALRSKFMTNGGAKSLTSSRRAYIAAHLSWSADLHRWAPAYRAACPEVDPTGVLPLIADCR